MGERTRRRMRRWVGEDGLSSSKRELGGFFLVSLYMLSYKGPDTPLTPEKILGRRSFSWRAAFGFWE